MPGGVAAALIEPDVVVVAVQDALVAACLARELCEKENHLLAEPLACTRMRE